MYNLWISHKFLIHWNKIYLDFVQKLIKIELKTVAGHLNDFTQKIIIIIIIINTEKPKSFYKIISFPHRRNEQFNFFSLSVSVTNERLEEK